MSKLARYVKLNHSELLVKVMVITGFRLKHDSIINKMLNNEANTIYRLGFDPYVRNSKE